MLDLLAIFTSGGLVLWCKEFCVPAPWPEVNNLIRDVLIQQRMSMTQFIQGMYTLKWVFEQSTGVYACAVFQSQFPVAYVEELLSDLLKSFKTKQTISCPVDMVDEYKICYQKWMERMKQQKKAPKMKNFQGKQELINTTNKQQSQEESNSKESQEEEKIEAQLSAQETEAIQEGRRKMMEKTKSKNNGNAKPIKNNQPQIKSPPKKEQRTWTEGKINSKKMKELDHSQPSQSSDQSQMREVYMGGNQNDGLESYFVNDEEQKSDLKSDSSWFSRLKGKVQYYTGNKKLNEQDLAPICEELKNTLINKNVNNEIASNLCDDVLNQLKSSKTEKFTTVFQTVKNTMQQSIAKILKGNRQFDILREALTSKNQGKPFVITFCGVNGVGKSTNLAKIAYMLKTKGKLSILISACDTFRSGAVEQLKRHANCLQVPLFEKGYGKDPALVTAQAINYAKENQIDVVLVDTAGRMQDNEHLMKNLAKLVTLNRPDLVLFVGEALVGNDGVDQLVKFNQALRYQTENGRGVDGVLLTKFDTVDDKMGAAISMVYATGKPIVYVGTGQKYTHLRTLNVETVVRNLLA